MTRFAFPELKLTRRYFAAVIFTSIAVSTSIGFAAENINIYSHRQQVLIQPFLDAFTAKTGIDTNVVYSSKGLAQRLKAEGPASPADVILTVDTARLSEYADLDLLAPVESLILRANITSRLRSEDNSWFGFSERARILVTSKKRVADGAVLDLEDLGKPEWKGRIRSRAG
ncbi:iron ABC transporter substrate-binding protein, partial [Alphaproteobacteria bacterium]|nr:iron ABC transporter substrate-binding protein [Alphaproteobacteria bacterium]